MSSTAAYIPTSWAEQVLEDINSEDPNAPPVPIDANTVGDITHWMPAEEPTSDWYDRDNPLNASLGTSASDGTGSYPDLSTAAEYTAKMINQSNMSGIRGALAADDPVGNGFSQAVVASPWASGHYGGNPLAIAQTGASPNSPAAPTTSGTPGSLPAVSLAGDATETAFNANPFDLFGIPQTIGSDVAGSIWSAVGPFIAKSLLVVAGLGLIGLGIYKTTDAKSIVDPLVDAGAKAGAVAAA